MSQQLVKIEDISIDNAPAIYVEDGLKQFISAVKEELSSIVPDTSTAKGRKSIASSAAKVSSSKKAVENIGRDYLKKLKAQPKIVEKELREFIQEMDVLRDETRQPLTDWEEEQNRIEQEKADKIAAEKLAAQIESDHEIAILLDEKYTREKEEAEKEAERQKKEHEQKIADQAKAQAEREKDEAIAREEQAKQRAIDAERQAKEQKEQAERDRIAFEAQAKANAEAQAKAAEAARIDAEAKAKQAAIDAANNARIQAEESAKRAAEAERQRIENERLQAEEVARKKAENKKHQASVNRAALADLINVGFSEEDGKKLITAIAKNEIRNISINY